MSVTHDKTLLVVIEEDNVPTVTHVPVTDRKFLYEQSLARDLLIKEYQVPIKILKVREALKTENSSLAYAVMLIPPSEDTGLFELYDQLSDALSDSGIYWSMRIQEKPLNENTVSGFDNLIVRSIAGDL